MLGISQAGVRVDWDVDYQSKKTLECESCDQMEGKVELLGEKLIGADKGKASWNSKFSDDPRMENGSVNEKDIVTRG